MARKKDGDVLEFSTDTAEFGKQMEDVLDRLHGYLIASRDAALAGVELEQQVRRALVARDVAIYTSKR